MYIIYTYNKYIYIYKKYQKTSISLDSFGAFIVCSLSLTPLDTDPQEFPRAEGHKRAIDPWGVTNVLLRSHDCRYNLKYGDYDFPERWWLSSVLLCSLLSPKYGQTPFSPSHSLSHWQVLVSWHKWRKMRAKWIDKKAGSAFKWIHVILSTVFRKSKQVQRR